MNVWRKVDESVDALLAAASEFLREFFWAIAKPGKLVASISSGSRVEDSAGLRFYAITCGMAVVGLALLAHLDAPVVFGPLRVDFYDLLSTGIKYLLVSFIFIALLIPGLVISRLYQRSFVELRGAADVAYYGLGLTVVFLSGGLAITARFGNNYWVAATSIVLPVLFATRLGLCLLRSNSESRGTFTTIGATFYLLFFILVFQVSAIAVSVRRFEMRSQLEAHNVDLSIDPSVLSEALVQRQIAFAADVWHGAAALDLSSATISVNHYCLLDGNCGPDNAVLVPQVEPPVLSAMGEKSVEVLSGERKFLQFRITHETAGPVASHGVGETTQEACDKSSEPDGAALKSAPQAAKEPVSRPAEYATHACISIQIRYFDQRGRRGLARAGAMVTLNRNSDGPLQIASADCDLALKDVIEKEIESRGDQ